MEVKHIIVDGYSILHQWEELAAARVKNLASGRQALIHLLTQFHDCYGGELTVVFDGRSIPRGGDDIQTSIQILYSQKEQTADALIERMVGKSPDPSIFLVATDDYAEQNTIESLGGRAISAEGFHAMVKAELKNVQQVLDTNSLKNRRFGMK